MLGFVASTQPTKSTTRSGDRTKSAVHRPRIREVVPKIERDHQHKRVDCEG